MITRRDFIKGMGALALIPFVPGIPQPEREMGQAIRYMHFSVESRAYGDPATVTIQKSMDGIRWDNTGTMTIPVDGTKYKVRYEVTPDGTEAEIVGEE
jgi:hypothetical protein